jgi:hypothetical protein
MNAHQAACCVARWGIELIANVKHIVWWAAPAFIPVCGDIGVFARWLHSMNKSRKRATNVSIKNSMHNSGDTK